MLASAYGWTVNQIDDISFPQLNALLGEIQQKPPMNFIACELVKSLVPDKKQVFEKQMQGLSDHIEVKKSLKETVKKVVVKKTGKRIY